MTRVPSILLVLSAACASAHRPVAGARAHDELLPVLARGELVLPGQAAESTLVASARDWQRLRTRLAAAALPPAPCDFDSASVLLVVTAASRSRSPLQCRVGTEEGIDVVTVEAADGGEPREATRSNEAARSRAVWLVVPARPHQLAVVLQEPGPRGVQEERTLAVHAPRE